MKLILCPMFALALLAQDPPDSELKYLAVPTLTSVKPVLVSAPNIERIGDHPSLIHLKGGAVIKTPVCVVTGPGNVQQCAGYVVLRADSADVHEDTGKVEAQGNVVVTCEP